MGFEEQPDFTQQLGIAATLVFKKSFPALGIDLPHGGDEQLSDSLRVGLHGALRSRSSAYHATSAHDRSGSWEDFFRPACHPGSHAGGDEARLVRKPSVRRRLSGEKPTISAASSMARPAKKWSLISSAA